MVLTSGCGTIRSAATRGLIEDVTAATLAHDDVDLVTEALPTYLLMMDGLLEGDPDDAALLLAAAEAYTSYAVLIEAVDPERAARIAVRARRYGTDALLARRSRVSDALNGPIAEFDRIDQHLRGSDLPYVFWAASAWGAWISTHLDDMAALADLPRVIHLMEWVVAQDESFRDGGAHIFLGVYHAARPAMLGGDLARSRSHFERALELTDGNDLMVHVQMARFYARQAFDRELYVNLLTHVLETSADTRDRFTLQNAAAQRLARNLLQEIDVYF